MEIYTWLFAKNEFKVAKEGVFVYCNGLKNKPAFKRHLEFSVHLISYQGSTDWIESKLKEIYETLKETNIPNKASNCEYCKYSTALKELESR